MTYNAVNILHPTMSPDSLYRRTFEALYAQHINEKQSIEAIQKFWLELARQFDLIMLNEHVKSDKSRFVHMLDLFNLYDQDFIEEIDDLHREYDQMHIQLQQYVEQFKRVEISIEETKLILNLSVDKIFDIVHDNAIVNKQNSMPWGNVPVPRPSDKQKHLIKNTLDEHLRQATIIHAQKSFENEVYQCHTNPILEAVKLRLLAAPTLNQFYQSKVARDQFVDRLFDPKLAHHRHLHQQIQSYHQGQYCLFKGQQLLHRMEALAQQHQQLCENYHLHRKDLPNPFKMQLEPQSVY